MINTIAPPCARCRLALVLTSLVAVGLIAPSAARAAPFTVGNVLVSTQQKIIEYTPAGAVVQTITIPTGGGDGGARDLIRDKNGNVQIYNGTFSPQLTQYNPSSATFSHQAGSFSTANNLTYGGIAAAGDFVYVTDMNTSGSAEMGLVRYQLGGGATTRFNSTLQYIDVTLGLDGVLYALRNNGINAGGTQIDKLNALTGAALGAVTLPDEQRAIAVDAAGDIYAVGLGPGVGIVHYSPSGTFIKKLTDPIGGLSDIDLNASGGIVITNHGGAVLLTSTALTGSTWFNFRNTTDTNFAAWVTDVPEPTIGGLLAVAGVFALGRRRRHRPRGYRFDERRVS